jgi:hypothetical protein
VGSERWVAVFLGGDPREIWFIIFIISGLPMWIVGIGRGVGRADDGGTGNRLRT